MAVRLGMTVDESIAVQLDGFDGPLDLLLHLIERQELDITAISLVQVTDQYLTALHKAPELDADRLSAFIVIGARLLYLKSRALLPAPAAVDLPESGDEPEDGEALAELLREYRRFRQAALGLAAREDAGLRSFSRVAAPPEMPLPNGLHGVTLETLARLAAETFVRRKPEREAEPVARERIPLEVRMGQVRQRVRAGLGSFRALFEGAASRDEVVVTFLAVLELLRRGEIEARQRDLFGDIELRAVPTAGG